MRWATLDNAFEPNSLRRSTGYRTTFAIPASGGDHMIAILRNSGPILLVATICACTQSPPQKENVWMGLACTAGTAEPDKIIVEAADSSAADDRVCIDSAKARIDFQPNSLRIEEYNWGGAALRMQCVSSSAAAEFFSHTGKTAGLVADNKYVDGFRVSEPTMGCGWQSAENLPDAIERCEVIAAAWKVEPESCSKLCDAKANGSAGGICIVSG